ncbi:helix-turn-helix domain-containing protein [Rummeliibacillus sp. POC4]|uniref:helix-turn-helix domain-containing protein n=1 Tax=Rummeliibacillus sp. POC4 TaxID=2305899 RepID=UPI000E676565|nr:helix-turn-helix transcriptional regulator [Rummeliibacillus sp. POC4]RIJ63788.1 XRE family transcriptional regulator [Rummeliibacillus sp. POC4]
MNNTINEKGLKLVDEIKLNQDYSEIKKEALINFGFDPINLDSFINWMLQYYNEDFEEITDQNIDEDIDFGSGTIDLLTESERAELGDISTADDENKQRKDRFKLVNKKEWLEIGQALKNERLELGISLNKMGRILNTSTSRISNLENGRPVMMADNLRASYKLALELERMKQQAEIKTIAQNNSKNTQINHIQIVHDGGELYILNLVTESGTVIHIKDIKGMKWAHMVAKNKFAKYLNVPIVLKLTNGEKVRLDAQYSAC